jgi:hypothetical protein
MRGLPQRPTVIVGERSSQTVDALEESAPTFVHRFPRERRPGHAFAEPLVYASAPFTRSTLAPRPRSFFSICSYPRSI